jgi:alkylation response protein AidB-like acyl-CoA dehydrogenase
MPTLTARNRIAAIEDHARVELKPLVQNIDRKGLYPGDYLQALGRLGGFSMALPHPWGTENSMVDQIAVTTQVSQVCGSTGFLVWCQSTCAWYLYNSHNHQVRDLYLPQVAQGTLMAGTGMSNTVKHLAGIERINLKAERTDTGYRVSGSLPWVSNVGDGHLLIAAAHVENEGYLMFATPCNAPGISLHTCPEFSGLEGTQTLNIRLDQARVDDSAVLAQPSQFRNYINRIKPGFVLGQTGMGLGIAQASLKTMRECNVSHAHVNQFLDDQEDELNQALQRLKSVIENLALRVQDPDLSLLHVLKARLETSELTLRATQSAALHAGAKGYLVRHPAQRHLREALFVAIVTPALKHLRKEISALESAATEHPDHAQAA